MKKKEALDRQEVKLKAEKEDLELQTALAAADAKLKILKKFEEADALKKDDERSKPGEQPAIIKDDHGEPETGHDTTTGHQGNTRLKYNPPSRPSAAQSISSASSDEDDGSIQFSFIYIAPNYNNCHLKALK